MENDDEEKSAEAYLAKGAGCLIVYNEDHLPNAFEDAIHYFEKALELSLSAHDEVSRVSALFHLAIAHQSRGAVETMRKKYRSYEELLMAFYQNEELSKALEYFERALTLDAKNEYKVLVHNNSFNILRLTTFRDFGLLFTLMSDAIKAMHGTRSAISYLEEKLKLLDYIPGTHMSPVYLKLGNYYSELGERDKEILCYEKTLEADTDYSYYPEKIAEDVFRKFHETARNNLRALHVREGKFFCRYCGAENSDDAIFCEGCGKKTA